MKGIILAAGTGSRLRPLTLAVNKHLLPVYDKPMIYYPLTTLMLAGISDILVIQNDPRIKQAFADSKQWGIRLSYATQERAAGIAEALLIAERFMDGEDCALILGDNIFYGAELGDVLQRTRPPAIFCYTVKDPERYGVLEGNQIIEKPKHPKSNWAVTGLYFYDDRAVKIAKALKPSGRGEFEITDVNNSYLMAGMNVQKLGRGFAWFDAGTYDSLLQVSQFIQVLQERQGLLIGDPREVAINMGYL